MHWIIPALTAPFINATVNFADKYLVSGAVKRPEALPVYSAFFGFFIATAVWAGAGFFHPGINSLFGVLAGITTTAATTAYFKLMARKDVSEAIFFFGMTPLFILVLAFVFLGEKILPVQLAGFVLVLAAVSLANFKKGQLSLKWSQTLALVLAVDGMWAVGATLMKFAINENTFIRSVCYEGWGMGLAGAAICFLFPGIASSLAENISGLRKRTIAIFGLDQILSVAGRWVEYFAYSIGPVALVSVVGGTQTFYCVLFGLVLTLAFPGTFREDIANVNLARKIFAAGIMIFGLYLIYG
jgi:drug/metabolite transporter (DMT)-like permease